MLGRERLRDKVVVDIDCREDRGQPLNCRQFFLFAEFVKGRRQRVPAAVIRCVDNGMAAIVSVELDRVDFVGRHDVVEAVGKS